MRRNNWLLMLTLLVLTGVVGLASATSGLSEDEARKLFSEAGCTSCHNNVLAPDFDGVIAKLREWALKYESLDEAVATEAANFKMFNNVKSWDELMKSMPGVTPELNNYFIAIFEEAKKSKTAQETQTPTIPKTTTKTTPTTVETTPKPAKTTPTQTKPTSTITYKKLPEVPIPDPIAESESLVRSGFIVGLALYLAAVGVFVIAWALSERRK